MNYEQIAQRGQLSDGIVRLLDYCSLKTYSPKREIIKPGLTEQSLYLIIDGSCKVCHIDPPSKEMIVLTYLTRFSWIGAAGFFHGSEIYKVTIITRETSKLAQINYDTLRGLLRNELAADAADILDALGKEVSRNLVDSYRKLGDFVFKDAYERILDTLIELARQPDAMTHPDGMQIKVSRQEMGRLVGCSREIAGRSLKIMEDRGLITVNGKTIVVLGIR